MRSLGLALLVGVGACVAVAGLDDLQFGPGGGGVGGRATGGAGPEGGFGGSGGAAIDLVFTDDELDGEFGEGTFQGTSWAVDHVALEGTEKGAFTSRVFDAGQAVRWEELEWEPGGPYGRPLPDDEDFEVGYLAGNVSMDHNVLLLHFDEPAGVLPDGAVITESSGQLLAVKITGTEMGLATGVLGNALDDSLTGYAFTPAGDGTPLNFGNRDYSWSYWVNTTQSCPSANPPNGNRVHLGVEETTGDETHLWLGCSTSDTNCTAPGSGFGAGTFRHAVGDSAGPCGTTVINDGEWHHLVVVNTASNGGDLRLYVDGQLDDAVTHSYTTPADLQAGVEFAIGAFSTGTYQSTGLFDEVAVFDRALDAEEVAAIFARGALRLELQVRVCDEPDCSDDPAFVGDGTNDVILDPGPDGSPAVFLPAALPVGQYFQYRVAFSRIATAAVSPELFEVTVYAALP